MSRHFSGHSLRLCLIAIVAISGIAGTSAFSAHASPRTQRQTSADSFGSLTVDPLFHSEQEVLAPDGSANDTFGASVAVSGDTALIGADQNGTGKGAAYIFTRSSGSWTFTAKLTASDGLAGDWFGHSVALDGDTAIVGAPGSSTPLTQQPPGTAYVFVKPTSGWTTMTETAKLMDPQGQAGDSFGSSVALSAGTALIGAWGVDTAKGAAYIFLRPDTGWTTTSTFDAALTNATASINDHLGHAVALTTDSAVITAVGANGFTGSSYVFARPANGWQTTSAFTARLIGSDTASNDYFGWSAAAYGDTVLIGSPLNNGGRGAAYIFTKPASGWTSATETAKLTASASAPNSYLGTSVALWDNMAIAGAPLVSLNGQTMAGAVYAFQEPSTGWASTTEATTWSASDTVGDDNFGWAVALSADTLLVGAQQKTVDLNTWQGAAYFYEPPWIVTNTNDSGPGSLRQVIADAASGDTITFAPGLAGQSIRLASTITLDKDVTIAGSRLASDVVISGDTDANGVGDIMVFDISSGAAVTLKALSIVAGYASPTGIEAGGITNDGSLDITGCVFSGNTGGEGGAIANNGVLSVADTTFDGNRGADAGGILNGPGARLTVTGISFSNNQGIQTGGIGGGAGAIGNMGALSVSQSTFMHNYGQLGGGAIVNAGPESAVIDSSTFSDNSTDGEGGAIYNLQGNLSVTNSRFDHNSAADGGGAIFAGSYDPATPLSSSIVTITASSFQQNTARAGGAISLNRGAEGSSISASLFAGNTAVDDAAALGNMSQLVVENSTFSSNATTGSSSVPAGVITNLGTLQMTNNTVSDNSAGAFLNLGQAELRNNILANSGASLDCVNQSEPGYYEGTITANIGNLIETSSGCGTPAVTTDPALGALADNGGPSSTLALLLGSPAIDAGDDTSCPNIDQRGYSRPEGMHCDIGAFEYGPHENPLMVFNTNDSGAGSLRQAIANAHSGDTVTFNPCLGGKTIILASTVNIPETITVDGAGLNPRVEISGGNAVRIFLVDNPTSTIAPAIQNVTLRDGLQSGTSYTYYGAALYVGRDTNLALDHVLLTHNSAYEGGAIYVSPSSTVSISHSEITNNASTYSGGAIEVADFGRLNLRTSTISNNMAGGHGAIHFRGGLFTIEDNVFADNQATGGAAIYGGMTGATVYVRRNLFTGNHGIGPTYLGGAVTFTVTNSAKVTIENNTFYGNASAGGGGGAMLNGPATYYLLNNTFSNNQGTQGGNLYINSMASVEMYNNILTDPAGGGDCYVFYNALVAGGNNLVEDGTASCLPVMTGDPGLLPLADNGGPTKTMALLPGGPAIDAGDDAACASTDQRGIARPQGAHCDIGAFELRSMDLPVEADLGIAADFSASSALPGDSVTLTATLTNLGAVAFASGISVTAALPAGLTYVSATASHGSYDPITGLWHPGSLIAGNTATLTIDATVDQIAPTTLSFTASVAVLDTNSGNNSDSASLDVLGLPTLSVDPSSKDYGLVKIKKSVSQVFKLSNTGQAELQVGTLALQGANASAFHLSGDGCSGQALAATDSCTVTVSFLPTAVGPYAAQLAIPSNATTLPTTVALSGYGLKQRLLNPNFNGYSGTSRVPTSWTATNFALTDGKDTRIFQEGASVRMTGQAGLIKTLRQTVALSGQAGKPLNFSFWVRVSGMPPAGACRGQVILYNGSKVVQTKTLNCLTDTPSIFALKSVDFNAAGNYTSIKVIFIYSKASGKVWFDTVNLLR